jgi:hypothetical protein
MSTNAPSVAGTDAAHQAVLRELSDIQQQILGLVKQGPPVCK